MAYSSALLFIDARKRGKEESKERLGFKLFNFKPKLKRYQYGRYTYGPLSRSAILDCVAHQIETGRALQCFEWRWTTIIVVLISVVTTNKIEVMNNDCRYIKIIYMQCGEETNIRDPRSYEHY